MEVWQLPLIALWRPGETRGVQDFRTRIRIFIYTLNISKKLFLMFTSSSRSANTNFFYSVYAYRWIAYLIHMSGSLGGDFHNNQIKIEVYL
jgi:hypothetical protein